jgi:fructose-bisphosphate aldolase/2-amino-3,7-dideoxy-D-threo-hept-6-ulosonate synthase
MGPIDGIVDLAKTINAVAEGGANAVVIHKGIVPFGHRGYGKDVGLIVHLSGSTSLGPDPNEKVLVCSVEEAIKLGADAVSVHINIGSKTEAEQLKKLGEVGKICREWGMPLLAMMYPRGEGIDQYSEKAVALASRAGAELGADIVKTNFTGSVESFKRVTSGCPVPVVVAGGPRMGSEAEILKMVEMAIEGGAKGVAIGRNIFQAGNPTKMTRAISMIVHENASAEESFKFLKG